MEIVLNVRMIISVVNQKNIVSKDFVKNARIVFNVLEGQIHATLKTNANVVIIIHVQIQIHIVFRDNAKNVCTI